MLEIVFLGTGSGIPSRRRNPASIFLRYGEASFLWDCGEGTQKQLMKARLSFMKIDRIFITHWHADHWAGIIGLMQTMNLEGRKRPLHVYGPDAERFVGDILDLDYWGPRFRVIPVNVPFEGRELHKVLEQKEFEMLSIPVSHSVPAVAYAFKERDTWNVDIGKAGRLYGLKQGRLVGKLKREGEITIKGRKVSLKDVGILKKGIKAVYTGDTKPCRNLETISRDASLLIHDATFLEEREDRMHGDVKKAAELARKVGVKRLVLTHFSRRYQDVGPLLEEAKKAFPNTEVAEDLMRIVLKKE